MWYVGGRHEGMSMYVYVRRAGGHVGAGVKMVVGGDDVDDSSSISCRAWVLPLRLLFCCRARAMRRRLFYM